ncbi:MAG TPA: Rid family hydrolase [Mycobacteriales bacterium]|nr:Rid family hydrolase [Mycobacteriales bacterium]
MPKEVISTPDAPQDSAYSQAIKAGNTVYVAGTIGVDVTTGDYAGPTIQEQTRQALLNCQAILRAAGAELSDAVMVHVLLTRPEDAAGVTEVINEFWAEPRPARCVSRIGVDRPNLLVSIAMTAVID